jgi:cytochrome c nitrite reductase small subunit
VTGWKRRYWKLAAAILLGTVIGLGVFTFGYAKGYSYLGHDPAACANCHVMSEHFAAWTKGSHHTVATCNDCHAPHTVVGKFAVKAKNGFWHSFYFTTGGYPDPLRITEGNRKVTEETCRYCHQQITEAIDSPAANHGAAGASREKQPMSCARCHRYVGHWVR